MSADWAAISRMGLQIGADYILPLHVVLNPCGQSEKFSACAYNTKFDCVSVKTSCSIYKRLATSMVEERRIKCMKVIVISRESLPDCVDVFRIVADKRYY